jgi:hypothetical protein
MYYNLLCGLMLICFFPFYSFCPTYLVQKSFSFSLNLKSIISCSVIVEALKVDSLQKLCSSLEPILRRVVRLMASTLDFHANYIYIYIYIYILF